MRPTDRHHIERPKACPICEWPATAGCIIPEWGWSQWMYHVEAAHLDHRKPHRNHPWRPHACPCCGMTFGSQVDLHRHLADLQERGQLTAHIIAGMSEIYFGLHVEADHGESI